MKRLGAVAALLLGIIVAVCVTGCSGGGNSSSSSSQDVGGSARRRLFRPDAANDRQRSPHARPGPRHRRRLRELRRRDLQRPRHHRKDLKIAPDIAKSWDVSPDGKTYTFHLRDDVVFQTTYRQVTASDFKYSIERAANPKTGSTVAEAYLGDIVGAKDMINGTADQISGIEAVDDFTLRITIDEAKPYFIAKLACPTAFVVDKTQVEADQRNWTRKPHGTGPFQVKDWKLGESITLQANQRYYAGVPQVSTVNYVLSGGSQPNDVPGRRGRRRRRQHR